jgi:hypothetical protein
MFKEGQNAHFNMYKWKLIHFILPCKELLKQWRIVNNSDYLVCKEKENYRGTKLRKKQQLYPQFQNSVGTLLYIEQNIKVI